VGIRYYYSPDDESKPVLVIVGVNEEGDDLTDGKIIEFSIPCPTYCGKSNDLNS
jgi:hypothetical protein